MTATQPHIASEQELAPLNTSFPFNRHKYEIVLEENKDDVKKSGLMNL